MLLFNYSAVTASGELVKGSAEVANLGELIESLRVHNLTLYRSQKVPAWLRALRSGKLGAQLTAEFCYFLSEYMKAGADLRLALLDMVQSAPSGPVRTLSKNLLTRIERGDALSEALRDTNVCPALVVNLSKVGEETGRIDIVLTAAALHYEQLVQMRSSLSRALLYPIMALAVLVGVVAFWVGFVIPKLATLFEPMMQKLPENTRIMLDGANWLRVNWPSITLLALVVLVATPLIFKRQFMRPYVDWFKWHAPVIKRIERARIYHLFFANLGVMYSAGMTLTRALEVLLSDPGNRLFEFRLTGLTALIRKGNSLSQAMQSCRGFESIASGMVKLGESTGSLAAQSDMLGEYYRQKVKTQTEFVVRMFEPMVLLMIGLLLVLVIITVISPVYDLAQQAAAGTRL